ncbi:hypothetical protein [Catenovulum agarivorans]|uniref:hypothetical protein n=1 Tax=Catenovulum agarivorans TaxID=1172192 RepID=UPI0002FD220F|nr:hypothetical protein [Catenovulum agarivorans]
MQEFNTKDKLATFNKLTLLAGIAAMQLSAQAKTVIRDVTGLRPACWSSKNLEYNTISHPFARTNFNLSE